MFRPCGHNICKLDPIRIAAECGLGGTVPPALVRWLPASTQTHPRRYLDGSVRFCQLKPSCDLEGIFRMQYPTPNCQGATIKTQAWVVRRLICIFSRAAKRGHVPRQREFRSFMRAVGMDPGVLASYIQFDRWE